MTTETAFPPSRAQDYHDARALCLADGEHMPSLSLTAMVQRLLEQRDRARVSLREARAALEAVPIPGLREAAPDELVEVTPAGRPVAGESVADKLTILRVWLAEDSDLPAGEVDDFDQALAAAIEQLQAVAA